MSQTGATQHEPTQHERTQETPDEATQNAAQDPRARVQEMFDADPSVQGLGIEFVDVADGRVTLRIPIRAEMLNALGYAHGGYLFAVADTAFAYAAAAAGFPAATHTAETTFVAPVRQTGYLEAAAHVVHRYGRQVVCDVVVHDEKGTLVGLMRGHGSIMKRPAGAGEHSG